jgi:glycerophosphoryl diester phosphodiesterase
MKSLKPSMPLSALFDANTIYGANNTTSTWLAGARPDAFGADQPLGVQVARAAASFGFDLLSPSQSANGTDPTAAGWQWLTTKEMIDEAHRLGLLVKPWTVNRLNVVEQLYQWGGTSSVPALSYLLFAPDRLYQKLILAGLFCSSLVDGIITDYPDVLRRWAIQKNLPVAPKYNEEHVSSCLATALRNQHF